MDSSLRLSKEALSELATISKNTHKTKKKLVEELVHALHTLCSMYECSLKYKVKIMEDKLIIQVEPRKELEVKVLL